MVSINTKGDRTLFFDFLPMKLGKVRGYDIRVQLFTVPGQVRYDSTRKVVLRGVDGIVFVADSLLLRREHNMLSMTSAFPKFLSFSNTTKGTLPKRAFASYRLRPWKRT